MILNGMFCEFCLQNAVRNVVLPTHPHVPPPLLLPPLVSDFKTVFADVSLHMFDNDILYSHRCLRLIE